MKKEEEEFTRPITAMVIPTATRRLSEEMRAMADVADGFGGGVSSQAVRDYAERVGALSAQAWLPIATAPKDGTYVLLTGDGWSYPPAKVGRWYAWEGFDEHDGFWESNSLLVEPTHWMPLPASPEAT